VLDTRIFNGRFVNKEETLFKSRLKRATNFTTAIIEISTTFSGLLRTPH